MKTKPIQTQRPSASGRDVDPNGELIAKALRAYSEAFPMYGKTLTPELIEIWCIALSDL
jgi:hypothetical protein